MSAGTTCLIWLLLMRTDPAGEGTLPPDRRSLRAPYASRDRSSEPHGAGFAQPSNCGPAWDQLRDGALAYPKRGRQAWGPLQARDDSQGPAAGAHQLTVSGPAWGPAAGPPPAPRGGRTSGRRSTLPGESPGGPPAG